MFTDRTAQTRAHYAHAAQNTTSLAEVTGKTPAFVYLVILLLLSFIPTFMTQKKKMFTVKHVCLQLFITPSLIIQPV